MKEKSNMKQKRKILSADYQILEAENGQEGLDILCENKETIALILLDVMMPVMDGYTFLNRIKKDETLALIPVIVMTQSENEEDEAAPLVHGAMDFIQNETAQPEEKSILNDIISMAHRMQVSVVAEGVETKEQLKRLQSVGCDYVQGYWIAKPMALLKFEELFMKEYLIQ